MVVFKRREKEKVAKRGDNHQMSTEEEVNEIVVLIPKKLYKIFIYRAFNFLMLCDKRKQRLKALLIDQMMD